jgi:hypothetical protein
MWYTVNFNVCTSASVNDVPVCVALGVMFYFHFIRRFFASNNPNLKGLAYFKR